MHHGKCTQQLLDSEPSVEAYFANRSSNSIKTKTISIAQDNHLQPFYITEKLLKQLLFRYEVSALFLDVVFNLSKETQVAEASYGKVHLLESAPHTRCHGIVGQNSELLQTADAQQNLSTKRTEVYHRISSDDGDTRSFLLMLNPVSRSKAEEKLGIKARDSKIWARIEQNPLRLDLLVISTYVDNWRSALTELAEIFQEQRRFILAAKFNDVDDFQKTINFTTMSRLQALEGKVQVMPNMIRSTIMLIDHLVSLNNTLYESRIYDATEQENICQALTAMRVRVDGYLATSVALETRISGIFKLVSNAMILRTQTTTANINHNALDLTKKSIQDNSVLKLATLATLFYLPGSFVAGIFGMNYFDFGDGAKLEIASNFWIYLAVTIPLTILTGLAWKLAVRRQEQKESSDQSSSAEMWDKV
ncbi:hypothetical protein D6D06_02845 [Aureobasidium pullulans]|nr:hypothetical protein D6D06_02845 [Aureobasidium pullulans]